MVPSVVRLHGPWLVRVFSKPVAGLVADGLKKVENLMLRDWLHFGNSGVIVTGVIQGAGQLRGASDFVPDAHMEHKSNPLDDGKIIALVVLGPIDVPSRVQDEAMWCYLQLTPGPRSVQVESPIET